MSILRKKHPITKHCKSLSAPPVQRIPITGFCLFLIFCCLAATIQAAERDSLIESIRNLAPGSAVMLNDEQGRELLAYNPDQRMIPASIVKILIAEAAYDLLGKAYRFKTEFYLNSAQSLAIKGWGDPFLISEEIRSIADELRRKKLISVRDIRLDASAFSPDVLIPGTSNTLNPYDALNGALVVNFNTLFLGRTATGKVYSAEAPTPLTPLAIEKSHSIGRGRKERINLTQNPAESLIYAGQLFAVLLNTAGVSAAPDNIRTTTIDGADWNLFYRHFSSKSLAFIFKGLMKYSNNFIANQVFLVLGAEKTGYPASLAKSRRVMQTYLKKKWGFGKEDITIDEASGISRKNRMTARQMISILESFREHSELLDGKGTVKLKSGTLTGVYNYAGYITTDRGLRPFVVMTENRVNRRDALLKLLRRFSVPSHETN